jgi:putative oxidoreductase
MRTTNTLASWLAFERLLHFIELPRHHFEGGLYGDSTRKAVSVLKISTDVFKQVRRNRESFTLRHAMAPLLKLLATNASAAVLLIRLSVGGVFLSEGIQKFLFPDALGVDRFIKIGIPAPEVMAPFVGVFEIACGVLLILGLLTRLAAVPMIIDMLVAISTTKIPILLKDGFWSMAHEARTDYAMLLGSCFLLIVGAGLWSLDSLISGMHWRREGNSDHL